MSKIDEKIGKAAMEFARQEHKYGDIQNFDALYKGFYHGARWALSNQWQSVEEAPPKYDGEILLCRDSYWVALCTWGKDRFVNTSDGYVFMATHWMPIPPLPEARKEGEEC